MVLLIKLNHFNRIWVVQHLTYVPYRLSARNFMNQIRQLFRLAVKRFDRACLPPLTVAIRDVEKITLHHSRNLKRAHTSPYVKSQKRSNGALNSHGLMQVIGKQ